MERRFHPSAQWYSGRCFNCCNSAHDDEYCTLFFVHLYFTGVSGKHVGIQYLPYLTLLSDRDTRGQLKPWRLNLAMIFN